MDLFVTLFNLYLYFRYNCIVFFRIGKLIAVYNKYLFKIIFNMTILNISFVCVNVSST